MQVCVCVSLCASVSVCASVCVCVRVCERLEEGNKSTVFEKPIPLKYSQATKSERTGKALCT